MRLETKIQLSSLSLRALSLAAALFVVGLFVIVLCLGLGVNPFREQTTSLLISSFMGLIGLCTVSVLLSVAANLSILADVRLASTGVAPPRFPAMWLLILGVVSIIIAAGIGASTYYSKQRYLTVVLGQALEVATENSDIIEDIARLSAKTDLESYTQIAKKVQYLKSQREGLPDLQIIFQSQRGGKLSLRRAGDYNYSSQTAFEPPYYACRKEVDCDYLKAFFDGKNVKSKSDYTLKDDMFYVYLPVVTSAGRIVLLFDKQNHYGKVGSY